MNEFFIVLDQILKFAIIILVGIICVKTRVVNEKDLDVIASLTIKVTLPIFIFCNTIFGSTKEQLISDFALIPLFAALYIVLIVLGKILSRITGMSGPKRNIYEALFIFGNVGFIGIPLISSILPERGMMYIALFTIVDQTVLWTLGVFLTSPHSSFSLSGLKHMLNPPLIAIFGAIIFVLCELKLPLQISEPLRTIGNATSPMSLIYIGGSLCFCNFGKILKSYELYTGIAVKMLIFPIILYKLLVLAGISTEEVRIMVTIVAALPTMLTIPMIAKSNGVEGEYCVSASMLTHILCLLTLPVVSYTIMVLF